MSNEAIVVIAFIIILISVFIILKALLNKTLAKEDVIEFVYKSIIWAEENIIGTKVGQEKLSYVAGKLNSILPKYLQMVITDEILKEFINSIFDIVKDEFEKVKE